MKDWWPGLGAPDVIPQDRVGQVPMVGHPGSSTADGAELPPGKANVGELVVPRAPWLTGGYFKVAEKSKELWRGWLAAHRRRRLPRRGGLRPVITDRLKDVIKTGGEWVSSLDLESLISQHEAVAEVAVESACPTRSGVSGPRRTWSERETSRGKLTADALKTVPPQTFVDAGHIERWAIPDQVVVVDALPKTSVGKLDKKALRQEQA